MSDFFNFLKPPQEANEELPELDFDNLNNSFRTLEEKTFDFSENEKPQPAPQTSFVLPQFPKIKTENKIAPEKRKRGNKKDNFDYDQHIQRELERLNVKNLSKKERKNLIQKIRNRMSAQRSRLRQKNAMKILEEQNDEIMSENAALK